MEESQTSESRSGDVKIAFLFFVVINEILDYAAQCLL